MLAGDEQFGVSIIDLHPKIIDSGHIIAASSILLSKTLFYREVEARLAQMGGELAAEVVNDWSQFHRQKVQQNHDAATATRKFSNTDGIVDFKSMTCADIWNRCRALSHQLPIKARLLKRDGWVFLEDPVLGPFEHVGSQPGSVQYRRPVLWITASDGRAIGFKTFKVEGKSSIFPAGSFYSNFLAPMSGPCFQ